ncbi:MAG: hypothetical protein E7663_05090 [Ruminococcaceae bacterium]|nr:hypothetical protein [Oscillospiraceae bacterium]
MKKMGFSLAAILLVLLALPLYVELAMSPAGKEGWYFTMFLTIDPIFVGLLGIFAGSDIKRLWFLPLLAALAFAPLFWLSTLRVDTDLFLYTAIYLLIAAVTMVLSEIVFDRVRKGRRER